MDNKGIGLSAIFVGILMLFVAGFKVLLDTSYYTKYNRRKKRW